MNWTSLSLISVKRQVQADAWLQTDVPQPQSSNAVSAASDILAVTSPCSQRAPNISNSLSSTSKLSILYKFPLPCQKK